MERLLNGLFSMTRALFTHFHEDIEWHTRHVLQAASLASKIPTSTVLLRRGVHSSGSLVILVIERNLLSRTHIAEQVLR